jgi:hypothetical protein
MKRHLSARAIDRARWFAELSAALDQAQRLLSQLAAEGASPSETEPLRMRLLIIRVELERLNRVSLTKGRIVGTAWSDQTPWPSLGT